MDQIQKTTGFAPSMHHAWAPWATTVCPNAPLIMKSFIAMLAGTYGTSTITNYVSAVRAWHVVHGAAWVMGGLGVDSIIKCAKTMAPRSSTKEKREPMTVKYIEKLRPKFSDAVPLDVAVFACLRSAFWATTRVGELTVKNLSTFGPKVHVKRSNLGESVDRKDLKTTTIGVPEKKSSRLEGGRLY